jgi:hypothetical protein
MSMSAANIKADLEATIDRLENEVRRDLLELSYLNREQVDEIEEILISHLVVSPIAQDQISERQMKLFETNHGGSD